MSLQYRHPSLEDAHGIYQLAKSTDQLDRYPEYFYLLWCRDFKGTSLIAEKDHVLAGFIIGYIRPEDPATLLIWQQAMSPKILNRGTGVRMLYHLTKKCVSNGTRFIEATIDPKNQPAERTLLGISKKFNTTINKEVIFQKELFSSSHHPELLIRLGPINNGADHANTTI